MAPIDIIILAAIGVAFVAVILRVRKKGTCADCAAGGGSCESGCSSCGTSEKKGSCPACAGVDEVADKLGRGVK